MTIKTIWKSLFVMYFVSENDTQIQIEIERILD
jgi:hypothetical protein